MTSVLAQTYHFAKFNAFVRKIVSHGNYVGTFATW